MSVTSRRPMRAGYVARIFSATRHGNLSFRLEEGSYQTRIDNLPFSFTVTNLEGAQRLFVVLAGRHRTGTDWPLEELPRKFANLPGARVLINDPSLALAPGHSIGWYVGSGSHSGIAALARLVDSLLRHLGLDTSRLYLVGEESAGLAAIQLGCRIGDCSVIAINPHTDIRLYNRAYVRGLFDVLSVDEPSISGVELDVNPRLSAVDVMRDSQETRILYYESLHRPGKPNRHFRHFCREFGIDDGDDLVDLDTLQVINAGTGKAAFGFRDIVERAIMQAETSSKDQKEDAAPEDGISADKSVENPFLSKMAPPETLNAQPWAVCASLAELQKKDLRSGRFVVAHRGGEFQCLLNIRPGSDKLFVMLCGATSRRFPHPDFQRVSWAPAMPGSTLYVADPALGASRKLALAWYVGTVENDWGTGLAELAGVVADRLGLSSRSVITYGSSGGGFAAIVAAARLGNATAVAINPQTHVLRYHPRNVRAMLLANFGTSDYGDLAPELVNQRFDAMRAFLEAPEARLLYLQNVRDHHHYECHYLPFCEQLGLPAEGGLAAAQRETWPIRDVRGHRGEPAALVPEILRRALALSDGVRSVDGPSQARDLARQMA